MKKIYYILALALLTACSADDIQNILSSDAVEITGFRTVVDNGSGASRAVSRATALTDTVGRLDFVANDRMEFTNIQRTANPISKFMYPHTGECIDFDRTSQTSWERHAQSLPERIYWTDAESAHTFIGYGCPQGANTPGGFDWNRGNDGSDRFYAYFGSLGNPTLKQTSTTTDGVTTYTNFIDYSNNDSDTEDVNSKKYYSGNTKICRDDILLAHNTEQQADPGGQVATIHYYHGLCCVRVIVNISGFAASPTSADSKSKVSDLYLLDMLTMYKWNQSSHDCTQLNEADQTHLNTFYASAGEENIPEWNQKKHTLCWIPRPNGAGSGNGRTFTFYALAVPTTGKTQSISFSVTYPDPMNPAQDIKRTYTASIGNLEFRAGHCTTINITLNHQNDKMTVGAEYQDWQFIESPDQGELKKNSTFLSYIPANESQRKEKKIYIANDAEATVDDATWLYKAGKDAQNHDIIKDIYDNDGSAAKPYTISTANQLLAFAYEVNSGRDFIHKFVKLDSDITLQSKTTLPTITVDQKTVIDVSKLVTWIGIGDESHAFNGFFLGNGRNIINLYGKHFFYKIGDNAVIDKVNFKNVVEVQGCGVVAHENNGLICSCFIEGDVKETAAACTQYTGSIVGTNNSFIIACSHIGKVTGYGKVGGLVGFNNGTVMASYHSGVVEALGAGGEAHPTVGAYGIGSPTDSYNRSIMFSCYYDSNVFKDNRALVPGKLGYPLPTSMMQSNNFVREDLASPSFNFTDGKYSGEGPILRTIAEDIVRQKGGFTEEVIRQKTDQELIAIILPANAMSEEVYKVFEHHFSLNTALRVFRYWLGRIHTEMINKPAETSIETNCHTFTKQQIDFLYQHYNDEHIFKYVPATYPKAQ